MLCHALYIQFSMIFYHSAATYVDSHNKTKNDIRNLKTECDDDDDDATWKPNNKIPNLITQNSNEREHLWILLEQNKIEKKDTIVILCMIISKIIEDEHYNQ